MSSSLVSVLLVVSNNGVHTSAEELVKHDPYGLFLSIMSITIVLVVLTFIYLVFKFISKFVQSRVNRKENTEKSTAVVIKQELPSGEVNAAIAMALHLYHKELHENEEASLTIQKIAHRYSPWSSKIYSMRNLPG